jgi:hypothetical protein
MVVMTVVVVLVLFLRLFDDSRPGWFWVAATRR